MKSLIVLMLSLLAFCASAAANEPHYELKSDGLYWANGNAYQRIEYTDQCWRWVQKYDSYTCRYCKVKEWYPCTKYKYVQVAVADPETGLERFALALQAMKSAEVKSELKVREGYAFSKQAQELAQAYGITNYQIRNFGQNLNYGDPYVANRQFNGFMYPALQGATQYGQFEYLGNFMDEASLTLLDVNQMAVMENEYEKFKLERESNYQVRRKELNSELVAGQGAIAAALVEGKNRTDSVAILADALVKAIDRTTPRATIATSESVPVDYGDGGGNAVAQPAFVAQADTPAFTGGDWAALVEGTCNDCHEDHAKWKRGPWKDGVQLDYPSKWDVEQLSRVNAYIGMGKMPKNNPLPGPTRKAIINWLSVQSAN